MKTWVITGVSSSLGLALATAAIRGGEPGAGDGPRERGRPARQAALPLFGVLTLADSQSPTFNVLRGSDRLTRGFERIATTNGETNRWASLTRSIGLNPVASAD